MGVCLRVGRVAVGPLLVVMLRVCLVHGAVGGAVIDVAFVCFAGLRCVFVLTGVALLSLLLVSSFALL